eukprot:Sdes_comp20878_c0_seq2m17869
MKFGYKFSNLCGTVYKQGNIVFTPDGNSLLSPVGNRVSVFDLVNNKSYTLPCENHKNISAIALSPNGLFLITVDVDGKALLINFPRKIILNHFTFSAPVRSLQFSPDGQFVAATQSKHIQVWKTPSFEREYSPFVFHRTFTGHYDQILSLSWTSDSRFFATTSRDLSARFYSVDALPDFRPVTLTGHKDVVIGCFFHQNDSHLYTISHDGAVFRWEKTAPEDAPDRAPIPETPVHPGSRFVGAHQAKFHLREKFYFHQPAKVSCVAFHPSSQLLVTGFTNGTFMLHDLPSFQRIQTLSIAKTVLNTVAINASGDWLGFGSAQLGQLLVWEWQSESHILKQQGHVYDMSVLAYSPTGQYIGSGGEDGKVKLWNVASGFCFVTFEHHSAGITGVEFTKNGHSLFSASRDGTVRAYDLTRYRNFRTFTSPKPLQFTTLAVDPTAQIVCAGALESFEIYVWSIQTGLLTEVLVGHQGPITCLKFSPFRDLLVSASWDKTVKLWNIHLSSSPTDTWEHGSDVLGLDFSPSGKQLAVSCLDGNLTFWHVDEAVIEKTIQGRRDLIGGRLKDEKISARNNQAGKCFSSICYSADGKSLLAAGKSKYVCIYDISSAQLVRRFQISKNRSLDGIADLLNSKFHLPAAPSSSSAASLDPAQGGPLDAFSQHLRSNPHPALNPLPGVGKGDLSARRTLPQIRVKSAQFSPAGRCWAAVSSEGLIIYSLDADFMFDPFDLEVDLNPQKLVDVFCREKQFTKAICMAFKLGEKNWILSVVENIPKSSVFQVVSQLPAFYIEKLLDFIASQIDETLRIDFYLLWCVDIFNFHGRFLKNHSVRLLPIFRRLQKGISRHFELLQKVCDENKFTMKYFIHTFENLAPDSNSIS